MAYNSSYITLVNMFNALENASDVIKARVPITATVQLEKTEYRPGEVVRGTVSLVHHVRLQLYGILAAVNGTIRANVPIRTRKWIDSVTNLHVFTFLATSARRGQDVVLAPSPCASSATVYPFSLRLPETNLPATFRSANGSVVYRVQVIIGGSGIYKIIGEQEFELAPYFNLNLFTAPEKLAKQSWQTQDGIFVKDRLKFNIIEVNLRGRATSSGVTMTKCEDSCPGTMMGMLRHKKAKLQITLTIPSISYCIGDEIPFRVLVENPNKDPITQVRLGLVNRMIYTAMQSKLMCKELVNVETTPENATNTEIEWCGKIKIPSDLTVTSSLVTATVNQPIIFQYILLVGVYREGREDKDQLEGATLLCVGTTADALPKPRKLIVDLETCKYPLGYTEMAYPEDWEQMYKTGRFGYVPNANVVIGEGVNPSTQRMNRTMSILSISKPSTPGPELPSASGLRGVGRSRSGSLSVASTSSSKPPAYSGLSSRRSSCLSLPPAYNQVVENDEDENED